MRASALLTVLLLTGAAAADTKEETNVGRVKLEDQTTQPRAPSQWLELADATPAKHGTEFVVVGAQQGSFSRLRVEAAKGSTNVKHVTVAFTDGTKKTYKVGKTVRGKTFAEIDLGTNKPIEQVVVTTDRTKGEYALYGSSGAGGAPVVSSR